MAKLQRKTQKVFASDANADQIAVFGSMKTGTPDYSSDVEELQSAEYLQGWQDAILEDKAPYLEEMNGVQYGLSYQTAYMLQEGIPEYDANTEYSDTSIVKSVNNGIITLYASLSSENLGNPLSDSSNWKVCELNLENKSNIDFSNSAYIPMNSNVVHITTTYVNGDNGYIIYSDGLKIQWGLQRASQGTYTITLLVPYSNTNYNISGSSDYYQTAGDWNSSFGLVPSTTNTITLYCRLAEGSNHAVRWLTVGY